MKRFMMFAVAAMFVCGATYGADEPVTTKQQLKVMQPFVGKWVAEVTAKGDWVGTNIKEGEKFTVHLEYSWLFDNTALSFNWDVKNKSGKYIHIYKSIIGWNAESQTIVTRGVFWRGAVSTTVLNRNQGAWELRRSSSLPDGTHRETEIVLKFIDDDTLTHQTVKKDGEPVTDESITFKRVKK